MPHCIIEYARPLAEQTSGDELMQLVFNGACTSGLFSQESIKTRAIAIDHYRVGNQVNNFIHVTLRILSGRNEAQRDGLAQAVLTELKSLSLADVSITVEVTEMERETYAKHVT